jgi:hypothetical protein
MAKRKRIRRKVGDVVSVPLRDGKLGYGRVLHDPLIAFYRLRSSKILPVREVVTKDILFIIFVMNYAITDGIWPVAGHVPLRPELQVEPLFFKKDPISGKLTIYRDRTGEEFPATREQCRDLECAAVWEPEHVVDRLEDHFAGRPNHWVESLRA